jgi:hypothetical protein
VSRDDGALGFEAVARDVEQVVEAPERTVLVAGVHEAQARAVDRDDADRAGLLGRAEQAVAALEQLGEVELQAAAHRADHVRVEVGVHEVLEVGQAVLRRHLEEASTFSPSQSKSFVMLYVGMGNVKARPWASPSVITSMKARLMTPSRRRGRRKRSLHLSADSGR